MDAIAVDIANGIESEQPDLKGIMPLAVHFDHLTRRIIVTCTHPTFDPVPDGQIVPVLYVSLKPTKDTDQPLVV